MNKNIKLAVAGAVLALSASANAGIIIPAGEWSVDISGNVNSFMNNTKHKGGATVNGGIAGGGSNNTVNSQGTGLLPNFLSVSGTTRQNDLDVTWLISIQPGGDVGSALSNGTQNNRQAFVTFGDKSWGSIKLGKDLGVFASDAILSDMTLLGVGAGAGLGNATYGRIGTGYIYADWKSQIQYTTPNMNGFQATVAVANAWNLKQSNTGALSMTTANAGGGNPAYEGKASYSFSGDTVSGKLWVSGIMQKVGGGPLQSDDPTAYAGDVGINANIAGFGLTGYYYDGKGIGSTGQFLDAYSAAGRARKSNGGYVQATYVLPTKTKAGFSFGTSKLDQASQESNTTLVRANDMMTFGLYHPLTKHLNLVGEYSHIKSENHAGAENKTNNVSLGGIVFF